MSIRSNEQRVSKSIPQKLIPVISVLLEAYEYAQDVEADQWEFAVPIRQLEELGCSETDLRWLVRKRYVEHAREVTLEGENGRRFHPAGDLTFSRQTCFVLTEYGVLETQSIINPVPAELETADANGNGYNPESAPYWDPKARILYVDNKIVKRFKWRAVNQETILSSFQEEGWPMRLYDPLPPQREQDSKRRLSDTIKCLNNKQANQLIRFHGDGTGEGITWERIESNGD